MFSKTRLDGRKELRSALRAGSKTSAAHLGEADISHGPCKAWRLLSPFGGCSEGGGGAAGPGRGSLLPPPSEGETEEPRPAMGLGVNPPGLSSPMEEDTENGQVASPGSARIGLLHKKGPGGPSGSARLGPSPGLPRPFQGV